MGVLSLVSKKDWTLGKNCLATWLKLKLKLSVQESDVALQIFADVALLGSSTALFTFPVRCESMLSGQIETSTIRTAALGRAFWAWAYDTLGDLRTGH